MYGICWFRDLPPRWDCMRRSSGDRGFDIAVVMYGYQQQISQRAMIWNETSCSLGCWWAEVSSELSVRAVALYRAGRP
ncbi:hypothetical protein SERLA73DRAFT_191177 [Serpula lacrymans var. lacrymans S7.3]|uniref:Uncharacterized protein n=2 Tax=Serpula lacrymans var. lacrymans TaxID=341189 RepID=F8QH15_SERL3|nr:uncharacterized protein SERLADRAFT_481128 [Serpula lacrymans var. lacrymans S7.9]EGN92416.1 hypothetical protein SERLA73DRAFT_191177 [Serpula lacrymans var. lacrymans S7.3]EGO18458.1 hypothetical protein SERLADRAFT_481128 [Serpula lacrymans var. lacrymans S7.9]